MLTIIIPSFNHEQYIVDCVKAACAVDVVDKRIIVIDDGSTDLTVENIRFFISETECDKVEVICKKNSGLISSLNLGLSMARTEFIYIVASDDIPVAKGIVESIEYLKSNPSCQFVIGGGVNFVEATNYESYIYGERHRRFFALSPERRARDVFFNYPQPILLQSSVFKVEALRQIGGWDSEIILDDYSTFIKLFRVFPVVGTDFVFKPNIDVVRYRHHGKNSYKDMFRQFFLIKQTIEALAPKDLKDRAVGKVIAGVVLFGLRSADVELIMRVMRISNLKSKLYSLSGVILRITDKIQNSVRGGE